ncbi:hypothetical protein [Methylobacterium nonmethylotrophicum]|uniref:Uncharacterized protein n=1 Tax=Methylobacterium nonmethylotrophicum TaxID=1141884 RepID=A0A4Z0NX63_9HYPH|nr:hypothetical protein [Methylobacterium nonmethylotrophicum]TGE01877.1 hypothetical protein EU555_04190 [Methylobacterium nonmethylotrophicum]
MKMKNAVVVFSAFAMSVIAGEASARTYTVDQDGADVCYSKQYIPNLVIENTRGRLVRGPQAFIDPGVGGRTSGGIVRTGVEPAMYIKTQRVVEREHYTLVPVACPR